MGIFKDRLREEMTQEMYDAFVEPVNGKIKGYILTISTPDKDVCEWWERTSWQYRVRQLILEEKGFVPDILVEVAQ